MTYPIRSALLSRIARLLGGCFTLLGLGAVLAAAESKSFDIPAGTAEHSLRQFMAQAGVDVVYPAEIVRGVRTPIVKGNLTPEAALQRLLADSPLVATHDSRSGTFVLAQVPNAPRTVPTSVAVRPTPGENNNAAIPGKAETLVLSPFTVSSEKDTGYAASSSLAGSRVRTDLRDIASPISVLTKDFLDDIAATNLQEALAYSVGSETNAQVADPANNNGGGDLNNPNANRVRGLAGADVTRNFFPTNIRLDTYNSTRLDLSRGPNSILFGLGSPAGIINTTTQRAEFRTRATLDTRTDSEGSHRVALAVNRHLIDQKLALFVAGLHEETQFWQKPSLDHQNRGYIAVQARPFRQTTINANYENYFNFRRLPRVTLARDLVSTWIAAGRPLQATFPTGVVTGLNPGLIQTGNTSVAVFKNGSLGAPAQFLNHAFEVRARGPHEGIGGVNGFALSVPPEVMPTDINISGAASYAEITGQVWSVALEQRIGDNFSLELAYNHEVSDNTLFDLGSTGVLFLLADPNVLQPNGQPNPDVGRFYFQDAPRLLPGADESDAFRLTATYNLDLTKRHQGLGRHQFSLLAAYDRLDSENDTIREFISSNHAWLPAAARTNLSAASRRLTRRFYIDDPFNPRGGNLAAVLDEFRLDGQLLGPDGLPVISDPFRRGHISNTRTGIDTGSLAGVWQSYLWKNRLVTTLGWRRDTQDVYQILGVRGADGLFLPAAEMTLPDSPTIADAGNTGTKGIAFHVTRWLSVYANEAGSFSPSSGQLDVYSRPLPGATGEGKDIGFGLRLFGDRLNLRLTRFNTAQVGSNAANYRNAVRFNLSNIEDTVAFYSGQPRDPVIAPAEVWVRQDVDAKGYELEAVANPTRHWRIAFNASEQKAVASNIALQARAFIAERLPTWERYYSAQLLSNSAMTVQQLYENTIKPTMDLAAANDGTSSVKLSKLRWNLVSNYDFRREGPLKGFSVGGAMRWVDAPVIGYAEKNVDGQAVPDITRPHYGAESFTVDGFVRFSTRLAGRYPLRVQLNIRNLLDDDDLVPVRIRSDRSATTYQPVAPRLFILSTSISY